MKHNLFSRFISVLLAVVMLAGLMSMPSLADTVTGEDLAAVTESGAAVESSLDEENATTSDEITGSTPAEDASDVGDMSDGVDTSDSKDPAGSADGENSSTDADTTAGQKSDQSITSDSDALENIDENANENIDENTNENTNVDSDVNGDVQEEVTGGASADATTPEGDDAGLADDAGENDIVSDNAPSLLAARANGQWGFTISCDGYNLNVYVNGLSKVPSGLQSIDIDSGEQLTKDQIISESGLPTYVQQDGQYYYLSSVAAGNTTDFDSISYDSWWEYPWGWPTEKSGWRYQSNGWKAEIESVTITYSSYDRPDAVPTVDTSNTIQIDLFDYDKDLINVDHAFKFDGNLTPNFNKWSGYVTTKYGFEGIYQDIVSANGVKGTGETDKEQYYPVLNQTVTGSGESLAYLFNGTQQSGKTAYTGLNHLFLQQDFNETGYYVYNSSKNFASLVGSEPNFTVYEKATTDGAGARFMPFNDITAQGGENYPIVGTQNFYYGMHIGFDMLQTADGKVENPSTKQMEDMVFEFNGDDDLWVFVDGVLILDLGGIHGAASGTINFSTGAVKAGTGDVKVYLDENHKAVQYDWDGNAVSWTDDKTTIKSLMMAANNTLTDQDFDGNTFTDWSNHRVDIYYFERGAGKSNCELKFNIQALPTGSLSVAKTAVNVPEAQKNQEYKFQLLDKDNAPVANAAYKINGAGNELFTTVDGYFTLQNGQYALFSELSQDQYTVQELDGDTYKLSDFTVVTNGEVSNKATVTIDPESPTIVSVFNTAVEKGQGNLKITKSFKTEDGSDATIPSDLDHIALTIEESYNATDHEDSFNQTHTVNLTWDETENAYVGTLTGVQYYTNFTVTDENMLNAAGEEIENASDWTLGDFVLNRYADADASADFWSEKNTTEYTLPNSGYVLIQDNSNWYLVMNHVPENATAKQEFKSMVIDKILGAVKSHPHGNKPESAEAVTLLSVTEAAKTYGAAVQFLNSGNVLLRFTGKSDWSNFYYGSFDMTNVTMLASLSNTLDTDKTIDIPVKKVWKDSKDHSGDTVTVALTKDTASYSAILSSSSSPEWSGEFEDVLKYDEDGNLIEYTASDVQEAKIAGYDSTVTGDMTSGFTVTNTPSSGYLTIQKVLNKKDSAKFEGLENGKNVFTFKIEATKGEDEGKVWYAFVDGNGYATLTGEKSKEEAQMQFAAGEYKITELSNINYTCSGATAVVNGAQEETTNTGIITVEVGGNAVTAVTFTNTVQNKGLTDGSGVINQFSEKSENNERKISFQPFWIAGDDQEVHNEAN